METISMKWQILFAGKKVTTLPSAELAQRVEKIKSWLLNKTKKNKKQLFQNVLMVNCWSASRKSSRWHYKFLFFFNFSKKIKPDISCEFCLLSSQFTWNVKLYFIWKKIKVIQFWMCAAILNSAFTFITLWAYLADNKLMIFFLFFPEKRTRHIWK